MFGTSQDKKRHIFSIKRNLSTYEKGLKMPPNSTLNKFLIETVILGLK